jgi:hypothetical protein
MPEPSSIAAAIPRKEAEDSRNLHYKHSHPASFGHKVIHLHYRREHTALSPRFEERHTVE